MATEEGALKLAPHAHVKEEQERKGDERKRAAAQEECLPRRAVGESPVGGGHRAVLARHGEEEGGRGQGKAKSARRSWRRGHGRG